MRGILQALARRGVAEVKARPVIVTNSPHAPWEGGYRSGISSLARSSSMRYRLTRASRSWSPADGGRSRAPRRIV